MSHAPSQSADPSSAAASSVRIPVRRALRPPRVGRRLAPTVAQWPLDVDAGFETGRLSDAATAIVRESLAEYRSGRADRASRLWHDDIVWSVSGGPPVGGEWAGPERIFAYHRLLERLSGGTFRQQLLALEGCRGSTVSAYLRTSARRDGRTLETPTLAIFELVGGRVRRVTEMPGDPAAWEAFWAD
jgi:ketosteroid isomerase-like protein